MGLLSFLKRTTSSAGTARGAALDDAASPDAIRSRVRRRFIGAALLVLLAVVVLPLVFETKPRPMPVDVAIDIPRRDGTAPLPVPAPRTSTDATASRLAPISAGAPASAESQGPSTAPAGPPPSTEKPEAPSTRPPAATPPSRDTHAQQAKDKGDTAPKPAPRTAEPARPREPAKPAQAAPSDGGRAQALLEGRDAKPAQSATRFVVQVGAFEQAAAAKDARQRVEKLGLKSFQQDVQTAQGKRIRVRLGPFSSREDAEKAVAKLGAGGIRASIVPL